MKNKLDRIEETLRKLFEERLVLVFPGDHQFSLLDDLVQVMRDSIEEEVEGQLYAPDRFIITIPAGDAEEWQTHQDVLDELALTIHKTGLEEGFKFHRLPEIILQNSPDISKNESIISATYTPPAPALPDTAALPQLEQENTQSTLPKDAFFVIGGTTNFPLESTVINLGRHSDNDLILEDRHVSRHHAQLRAIKGSFVIFDVGSTSGLFLNGKKITQATLQTGDVIRLGMTNLIYIQESTGELPTSVIPVDPDEQNTESAD